MIPKKIHSCWFGGGPKAEVFEKCQRTWREVMPDYEFKEWNETNSPMDVPFVRETYWRGLLSLVSNYVRLHALFEEGGIYLDTDVEVLRRFDPLLDNRCFLGFSSVERANSWVSNAVMGCEARHPFILSCLERTSQELERTLKAWTNRGPLYIGPHILTEGLIEKGLQNYGLQRLGDVTLYPTEYFYPYSWNERFVPRCVTPNTFSVHHWARSWMPKLREARAKCARARAVGSAKKLKLWLRRHRTPMSWLPKSWRKRKTRKLRRYYIVAELLKDRPHRIGAEVGVSRGVFSEQLLHELPGLRTLHCVDPWEYYREYDGNLMAEQGFLDRAYAEFLRRTRPYRDRVNVLKMFSADAARQVADESLDFVFIDANHKYEYVREDIALWTPKVREGGLIAGHDYACKEGLWGVKRAVDQAFPGRVRIAPAFVWWVTKAHDDAERSA